MLCHEIEYQIDLKEHDDKTRMLKTLLKGQALSSFEHHFRKMLEIRLRFLTVTSKNLL
jgi:hypothetical protein